ncbi:type VI secretion system lipoprotein TssJ [Xanthobacteraceae bacterium A53D]
MSMIEPHGRGARSRRALLLGLAGVPLALVLPGCAAPGPPPPIVTPADITLRAAANINPNADGVPSPVVVKIYELKSQTNFMNASFFELLDSDVTKIGPDLLSKQELEILPGAEQVVNRTITGDVKYLGIIVGFRDINASQWRSVVEVVPGRKNSFLATITSLSVTVTLNGTTGTGWFGL